MGRRLVFVMALGMSAAAFAPDAQSVSTFTRDGPKTWDDRAIAALEVPLARPAASPRHIPASYYYRIPVRPIFKSYPLYAPGREPAGYFDSLRSKEPEELLADMSSLKTEDDWIRAGEIVFDAPLSYLPAQPFRDARFVARVGMPIAGDGTIPFLRYFVTRRGDVRVGTLACGVCHTRLMADGRVVKGAQGNFPFDRMLAAAIESSPNPSVEIGRHTEQSLFGVPWLPDRFATRSIASILADHDAVPPGVIARHRTEVVSPVQVPDLIGVKDRTYLDHTGLQRHRGPVDLMRYAALNQGADDLASFAGFVPAAADFKTRPDPATEERYSDDQLYALALFVYSLEPPPNPNAFDASAARGQAVFEQSGCARCHTPPLYTSNTLTPAAGFKIPKAHLAQYDITPVVVGTDPRLAMTTRRGTGYYKVPSLKGVWYRGPFEHNGSIATLEDWFDAHRLDDDYVPTGFKGAGVTSRAVPGHRFGLTLRPEDKAALIAFLKTL
jgi:hypothetical protein